MAAPIATNPVTIFLIVLGIILLAPLLLNRLKIPHIIGMIVAGIIVGPHGLNILARDSSFAIFGQVGLLYLMFLAGLEIDMYHLKLNLRKGLIFGLLTFLLPMIIGVLASVFVLHVSWLTATLLAAMYASHTLIGYPVAARYGVTKSPAVLISIVGTIVAVIASLLVLAGAVNVHESGALRPAGLLALISKLTAYCLAILYVYPRLTRIFFKSTADKVSQFVFILVLVFLSAWTAKQIGLEEVLGAFFAGLVLNRYVPASSPLMSRIEFVGNALFIPYFLIGVGMMINIRVVGQTSTLAIASVMLAVAIAGKWLPAFIAQKVYRMPAAGRRMMFGLTTAHTAVALAVVTIGYNMTDAEGHRLIDETILNGTILVILVTCAIAPIVTAQAAARIKIDMLRDGLESESRHSDKRPAHILIPVSNPLTAAPLVELALLMRSYRRRQTDSMYAIHVRGDNTASSKAIGQNSLEIAVKAAAAADTAVTPIERYDLNAVTGIVNTIEERDISAVVMGMHRKNGVIDTFLGAKIEQLMRMTNRMLIISRCYIPLNTVTRIVVYVPPKAEYETGFSGWVLAVGSLARELGCRIIFCCNDAVRPIIQSIIRANRLETRDEYRTFESTDDFVLLANKVLDDDLFIVIAARANSVSYTSDMKDLPDFLQRYFSRNNLVIIFPEQFGDEIAPDTFIDPLASAISAAPSPVWSRMRSWLRKANEIKKRFTHSGRRLHAYDPDEDDDPLDLQ
ncbi:MAG: cation:proton antiporter [Muribaculaceae bacterium]|nr:cation:proton antiporter [Muribaculaceae bacterium]